MGEMGLFTGQVAEGLAREFGVPFTERQIQVALRGVPKEKWPPLQNGKRRWGPAHIRLVRERVRARLRRQAQGRV